MIITETVAIATQPTATILMLAGCFLALSYFREGLVSYLPHSARSSAWCRILLQNKATLASPNNGLPSCLKSRRRQNTTDKKHPSAVTFRKSLVAVRSYCPKDIPSLWIVADNAVIGLADCNLFQEADEENQYGVC